MTDLDFPCKLSQSYETDFAFGKTQAAHNLRLTLFLHSRANSLFASVLVKCMPTRDTVETVIPKHFEIDKSCFESHIE